ncbi:hypothetical protein GR212_35235 [Rhizobium lusitanum]|uniref:Uncharacterized protein n=1 Tax=Rhizobium lusitanum TaxID=293958 RepID=A0A6L9UJQ4_9HYPH|nr:hypothetical protein [Rhizobium lusitanum]NEI74798.1 hypothetical protein [Rhizobium lusitanum]
MVVNPGDVTITVRQTKFFKTRILPLPEERHTQTGDRQQMLFVAGTDSGSVDLGSSVPEVTNRRPIKRKGLG